MLPREGPYQDDGNASLDQAITNGSFPPLAAIHERSDNLAMILLSLLASALTPSDAEITKAAEKCGFQQAQIIWSTDTAGKHHADITPNGDLDSLPFSKVECLMRWNAKHQAKIGFAAQPPASSSPSR